MDGPCDLTPSEAASRGICPGCLGSGWVVRFVPVEHEGPCSTCLGTGRWPPGGEQLATGRS